MALLNDKRNRLDRPGFILLLTLGTLAGCALIGSIWSDDKPFAFPHQIHYEDEGLDCTDCHLHAEDDDSPGMPNLRQCMLCHEEIDADKPADRHITAFFIGNDFQPARVGALSGEIVFPHLQHATGDRDCWDCHVGIEANEWVGDLQVPTMDSCMSCHEQNGAPNDCTTCHSEQAVDVSPVSHAHNWVNTHGKMVRAESTLTLNRCDLCHNQSTCVTCHQDEPPLSHNNFFRNRGHGIVASMDRRNCATCHRSDFCASCHQESRPQSHMAGWGSPTNQHCTVCHLPLNIPGQNCVVCHKGTPSHNLAAPKPPGHSPAANCRQCHGITAPLPHPDPGINCNICHR